MKRPVVVLSWCIAGLLGWFTWVNLAHGEASRYAGNPGIALPTEKDPIQVGPFHFSLGSRFIATKTPTQLASALRVYDLIPPEAYWQTFELNYVELQEWSRDSMTWTGNSVQLTEEMRNALGGFPISSNFRIAGTAKGELRHPPGRQPFEVVYYVTVVPETEAKHPLGLEGFAQAVRDASKAFIASATVDPYAVQSGRLSFEIDQTGQLTQLVLESSCGYLELDTLIASVVKEVPGSWEPARNASGIPVRQTFHLTFGSLGC